MEVFFIRYRKILLVASVFMFLYFFYEMYKGINSISLGKRGEGIGTIIDAGISLFVSIYFFVNIRKANLVIKQENAPAEARSDINKKA